MDIPIELICKIMSYIPKKKCNSCYRCNKQMTILDEKIICYNKVFCSTFCTEYQHY